MQGRPGVAPDTVAQGATIGAGAGAGAGAGHVGPQLPQFPGEGEVDNPVLTC